MTRVSIETLGCKVNAYDTATIADRLRAAGCDVVPAGAPADVVIVNSCTVTDAADAESRRLVRRARRSEPAARIVLTGCYAQTKPAEAAGLDAVDHVVGLNRIDDLVAAVTGATGTVPRVVVGNSRREDEVRTLGAETFDGQTRAFLKVQEGCDLFCTFCIVPLARGASRSVPPRRVLAEVQRLARRFVEIVLTGVHLGGWGSDLEPRLDLTWLLAALAEQGCVPRLRLSSIDPHEVTPALVRRMATISGLCRHLHVPLQAGDDDLLRRMRRRYDVALARERLALIRRELPDAAIGTDLIAGFPGEDDAAFERTCAFVEESPLTYLHVFPYSVRSGTTAAKLDGHVPSPLIAMRARRLRAIGERKRADFTRRFTGTTAEILVEKARDPRTRHLRGYTRNYLRVLLDGPDEWAGGLIDARLELGSDGRLRGVPVAS